jgi:hypothetical protein
MSSKFFGNKNDNKQGNKPGNKIKGKGRSKSVKNVGVKKSGRGK